jgi:uncharacterized protein YbaP (TraB family)
MTGPKMSVVERSASKVFLFAETVGIRRDDVWLTDPIRAAFDGCREFWCEVAGADEIASSPLLAEYGLSAEPLSTRLDEEVLRYLQETARAVGVDPTTLEGFRPWLAGQLLERAHRLRAGVEATGDVHGVLLALAKDAGKVIRTELPDANATLSFFANLGAPVELEYLLWTLDRVAAHGAELNRQVAAWMVGDGSVVEQQVAEMQTKYPGLYRSLLADRNRAWIPRIDAMLDRPGSVFVLVGDSHLAGDDGIPALLTRSGLRPEPAA